MTSVSKNVYVNKLEDLINKYNNAYHRTIKMNPVNVKSNKCSSEKVIDKDPKFKMVIKTFSQKFTLQIEQKTFLW